MRSLFAAALLPTALLLAQPQAPAWLAHYPGASPQTKTYPSYVETTYTTPAAPAAVSDHYRKLFEAAGLTFLPNSDGVGVVVRAAAPECDLLLSMRAQAAGTSVRLSCAAKSPSYTGAVVTTTTVRAGGLSARSQEEHQRTVEEMAERHKQLVVEMGIHREYHDAPAPPLAWPDWLVHLRGARLAIQRGVDQSHRDYLRSRFTTSAPMTQIFTFYEDLLNANGYRVHSSKLGTGQTISGVTQNSDGYVEGTNYPNGPPGPRTVIRVSFSRFHLNDPIDVELRFTTYSFEAMKR